MCTATIGCRLNIYSKCALSVFYFYTKPNSSAIRLTLKVDSHSFVYACGFSGCVHPALQGFSWIWYYFYTCNYIISILKASISQFVVAICLRQEVVLTVYVIDALDLLKLVLYRLEEMSAFGRPLRYGAPMMGFNDGCFTTLLPVMLIYFIYN